MGTTAPSAAGAWPPAVAGTPAAAVIDRAIGRDRLGHSLLLHGDSLETLVAAARAIAERLLPGWPSDVFRHPDCFALRPAGKMRQIGADATRALIAKVQVTAGAGSHKVAVVHEADRMNATAANIFLKTLEEPPPNTTVLMITAHPYALLPTIRSRCLHFRFPSDPSADSAAKAEGWAAWLADYRAWLGRIPESGSDREAVAEMVFSIYGLIARFGSILEKATAQAWDRQREAIPPDLDDDEREAIETGIANGLKARFFAEIEEETGRFARPRLDGDPRTRRAFAAAIGRLERGAALLRVNLNELAALEDFLLAAPRLWSGR